jgi:hypothetical protein
MTPIHEELTKRIRSLEKELAEVLDDKQKSFRYRLTTGKPKFDDDALAEHHGLKLGLFTYLRQSEILSYVTAPIIYACVVPFALLDLSLSIYQAICFPVYGVPKVKRSDYFVFDRGHLRYLNLLERLNCVYCSYGNAVLAYGVEIAGRTEQHWCPIKHARRLRSPHSRYSHFFDYGDARQYSEKIETVRNDFVDLRTLTETPPEK